MVLKEVNWRRTYLGFFLLFFMSFIGFAQTVNVTGTVTDESGEGLPGVAVQVKGTTNGTITNIEGGYSLQIAENSTLVFSFIGYQTREVNVGSRSTVDVTMELDLKQLDEVVVVGYGTMKKSDLTGAVTSIDADEVAKTRSANAVEVLQGKSAGVDIVRSSGRAGSGYDVQIRGNRSLSGDNSPLYIVDGIPFGNELTIDPNDIASIEVLKDASSTAIYGSRGANGVVIVTTKSGDSGKPTVSFNTYAGITKPIGSLPLADRDYFLQLYNDLEWMRRYQFDNSALPRNNGYLSELRDAEDPDADYDWYDALINDGMQQNYNFSFSGRSDKLSYNTSLSYYQEDGLIENDQFRRATFRINLEGELTDNISIGTNTLSSFTINNQRANPLGDARKLSPLAVPFDSAGNIIAFPRFPEEVRNPFITEDEDYHKQERRSFGIFSTIYANFSFLDDALNFRTSLNFDLDLEREGYFDGVYPGIGGLSSAEVRNEIGTDYTFQNVLTYNKNVSDIHQLNFTLGSEVIFRRNEMYRGYGQDLGLPNSQWYALGSASETNRSLALDDPDDYPLTESSLVSYFGRIHYGLLDRYLFQFTGRYDGSSRLAEGNKWDFFPSASFAWRVIEEPFIPEQNVLTDLKLRAGYGVSGNQAVDAYASLGKLISNPIYYEFGLPESQINAYRTGVNENPQLGWEQTAALNFGVDFELFNGRISGAVDRYFTHTTDVLMIQKLSPHSGIPEVWANVGETKNDGFEVALNANVISVGDFNWNTTITYYSNDEQIVALASGAEQDLLNGWFVGQPFEVHFDRKAIGIWQLDEADEAAEYTLAPGDIKFEDLEGEDDRQIIGTPRPEWTGGFNNNFSYKGFDLSILMFARIGQTIRDEVRSYFAVDGLTTSMMLDYWTPFNPSNTTPRLDPTRTLSGYQGLRALEYVDGSFVKIRDLTLGYNFPSTMTESLGIGNLRVYATVKNPFIFGAFFDGGNRYDPELEGDIEIPMPRLFAGGLNVVF